MPTRPGKDGSFRIRRKLRGYGDVNMRISPQTERDATRWENVLLEAYEAGHHGVVDALIARTVSFPEVIACKAKGGWPAVIATLTSNDHAGADVDALIDQYQLSRKEAVGSITTESNRVRAFVRFLRDRHGKESKRNFWKFWTNEELTTFRDALIDERYAERVTKLESERMLAEARGEPPIRAAEKEQILDNVRGSIRATANRYVNAVGGFSTWLMKVKPGVINVSPAKDVRWSTKEENRSRDGNYRYLEPPAQRLFFQYSREFDRERGEPIDAPDSLFFEFLHATGARTVSEGTYFRISHVQNGVRDDGMVMCHIRNTKNPGQHRDAWLPEDLFDRLEERARRLGVGHNRPIFPFTAKEYGAVWHAIVARAADGRAPGWESLEGTTPYDLRHTFAVNTLRAGADLEMLRRLMGHGDIKTTMMYAKHIRSPTPALAKAARAWREPESD